ncbi:Calx-beta domain-containing protein [Pelagibius sp.]|uniref:Calx-beta domain-containing protein n=1 Tax=Pelagibius sp. TaxID=1931238 RepID=UPI00260DEECE|nr:Calx-beta domain-containing protein [Pelagibius sp.]
MRAFRSQDEREQTAGSEGRLLFDLRESFAESFAYDVFSWISIPPSKVSFRPTQPAERQDSEHKGIGAPETDGTEGPVALYTTTNSDIAITTIGEIVPFEGGGGASPASNTSGPLIDVDDFRADARFAGVDGSGYSVVVLDTGIDLDDPFFGPDSNGDGVSDRIVYHYDFADGDADASDVDGHGSNVTSIAASSDGTYTGMAPGADIISLKVFTNAGTGNFGYVEQALQWVINNAEAYNIASVNMSLSDSGNYSTAIGLYGIADELSALAAMNVIVVSASGNDFYEVNSIQGVAYPSADPNSLSVGAVYDAAIGTVSYLGGAVAHSTTADQITPFSQRDHELSDIFAPGAPITGAGAGAGLVTMHGTSQASPHIAGIAALAQQLAEQELGRKLTVTEFTDLLASSGDSIFDGDDENDNVANTNIAYQRVNVLALAEAILALAPQEPRGETYFQVAAIDKTKPEGDAGTTSFSFEVIRSGDTTAADTIDYSVASSGGTPANASDFLGGSFPSGSITFGVGETSKIVTVQVTGDSELEADESFTLSIANVPANGQIVVPGDEATIANDDTLTPEPVVLLQADFDQNGDTEGFVYVDGLFGGANPQAYADGSWSDQALGVTLGGQDRSDIFDMSGGWQTSFTVATESEVTLSFAYVLTIDSDYESSEFTQVLVSIDGGPPVLVDQLTGDGNGGSDQTTGLQTFTLALGSLAAGSYSLAIGAYNNKKTWSNEQSQLTIDDVLVTGVPTGSPPPPPTIDTFFAIAAEDAVKPEGHLSTTAYSFTVTRSGDTTAPGSVDYAVTGSGVDGNDFAGGVLPSGTLSFAANETSKILTIDVAGDGEIEVDEGFGVVLSNPSAGAGITTAGAMGIILNDDPATAATFYNITALDAVKAEGDAGITDFTFTVARSGDTSAAGTVDYAVNSQSAGLDDFLIGALPSGTLDFVAGETSKTLTISVTGDTAFEADESFTVALSNPSGGSEIVTASADGTILNDDPAPPTTVISILATIDSRQPEGDSGTTTFSFSVNRSGDTSGVNSVDYAVTGGVADLYDFAGSQLPSGTVTFAAGETTKTITMEVAGDTTVEGDESFSVSLSNPTGGAQVIGNAATGIIFDDDTDSPTVSFKITADAQASAEGDDGGTAFTFTVWRTGDLTAQASIDYQVSSSEADADDFIGAALPGGTLTFVPGEVTKTLAIDVADDTAIEGQETFTVTLVNPSAGAGIAKGTASTVIADDDAMAHFAIAPVDAVKAEGDAGTTAFTFLVTRSGDTSFAGTVDYAVTGTEVDRGDFAGGVIPSGTLAFAAGETSKTITVNVSGNLTQEGNEDFTVELSNPSPGIAVTVAAANGTILDDDNLAPTTFLAVTAKDAEKIEGDVGSTPFIFTVTRSGDTSIGGSVDYAVTGGQVDGSDFVGGTLPAGTMTFASGEVSKDITIEVNGDGSREFDESFTVTLFNPSDGSELTNANAVGTILKDEPFLATTFIGVSGSGSEVLEGDDGTTAYEFTFTRSGELGAAETVNYVVSSFDADGSDFVGGEFPSGSVSFAAGQTTAILPIEIAGDTVFEANEYFRVDFASTSPGSHVVNPSGGATIRNDDQTSATTFLSIESYRSVSHEGHEGIGEHSFRITRSGDLSEAGWADYAVFGYGDNPAQATDFIGGFLPSGRIEFAAGEESQILTLYIQGDREFEPSEQFAVSLTDTSPNSVVSVNNAVGRITSDDNLSGLNSLSIAAVDAVKAEGDAGTTSFTFAVTRGGEASGVTTLDYRVVAGDIDIDDFAGDLWPEGSLSFTDGETSKTITIEVAGDTDFELFEDFTVGIFNGSADAHFINAQAVGTIQNDDPVPGISAFAIIADDAQKAEGNTGATPFTFLVTRSGDTSTGASVSYSMTHSVANDGALGSDFVGGFWPTGRLDFAPGETSKVLTIDVQGDSLVENDENFTVTLSNPSFNASITTASADAIILNDDAEPPVSFFSIVPVDAVKQEGDAGTTDFSFVISRSGDLSRADQVVNYQVTGADVDGADFSTGNLPTGGLTFLAGEASRTITIPVAGDTGIEDDETFFVTITTPSTSADIDIGSAGGTILNDDTPPSSSFAIAADDAAKAEGDAGTTAFTFTVTRTGDSSAAGSVDYAVSGNGATASDFAGGSLPNGTLSFNPGETSKTLTIDVQGDTLVESDEGFTVTLSNPSAGSDITTPTAAGTIVNDDSNRGTTYFFASRYDAIKTEGDGGTTAFTFLVTRSGDKTAVDTIDFTVTGSGANPASADDFAGGVLPSGVITFAVGATSQIVTIQVAGDSQIEPDENFTLTISNPPPNGQIQKPSDEATIENDDFPPGGPFEIIDADFNGSFAGTEGFTYVEGVFGGTTDPTLTRGNWTAADITVVLGGGSDSTPVFNMTGGWERSFTLDQETEVSLSFLYDIIHGRNLEADEYTQVLFSIDGGPAQFVDQISGGAGSSDDYIVPPTTYQANLGLLGPGTHTLVIGGLLNKKDGADEYSTIGIDDVLVTGTLPAPPATFLSIAASDAVKAEGDAGTTAFTFTVTRSGDTAQAGSVDYAVTSSQADGGDFLGGILPSGTVSFAAGETSKTITLDVAGDTDFESDEAFTVTLSNPSAGLEITTASAVGTIQNDDPAPPATFLAISPGDAVKAEGDVGTTAFTFTVTRSGDTTQAGNVDYAVTSSQADGGDFQGGTLPSGTVSFAAGETSKTITLDVTGDTDFESDEAFTVTLSNPSAGSEITTASAAGTILNDDPAPPATFFAIAADDAVKAEGDAGSTAFTFTVTRSGDSSQAGTIDYAVTSAAAEGGDFVGGVLPSGSVSFAAGEISKTLTVQVAGDTQIEGDEAFTVTLSNPSAGSAITTASAGGTILNDDSDPPGGAITLIDESFDGTGDTGGFSYQDGSFGGADPQSYADGAWADGALRIDMGGIDNSNVTDMSGGWTRDFTLDAESEITLSFLYELAQSNGYESDEVSQLLVSIDGGPPILVNSLTGDGNGGGPLTTGPQTYSAMLGVLAAGSHSLTIGGFNNKKTWNNEATELTIDDVSLVATPTAPPAPIESSFAIAPLDAEKAEGDSGPTALSFTVTRSGDLTAGASVDFAVAGSGASAADAADFAGGLLPGGSLSFGAGESSRTLIVEVAGDTDFEGDETFLVTLSNPSPGSDIVTASAGGTILNDDSAPVGPIVLIDADFNANGDSGGFVYADGTFGGANPQAYAEGSWQDQALTIALGGIDGSDVLDISGAWESSFVLATEMDVTLSFSYELILSPNFESDEFGQVLYNLDGGPDVLVDQVTGNGNGGAADTTGPQNYLVDLGSLAAGTHSIALGGLINQKTFFNESADLIIDDVLITGEMTVVADAGGAGGGSPWQPPTADPLAPSQETEILTLAGL